MRLFTLVLLSCALGCGSSAQLHAEHVEAPPQPALPSPEPVRDLADLERVIALSLALQHGGAGLLEEADSNWLEAHRETFGLPRSLCSHFVHPSGFMGGFRYDSVPEITRFECRAEHCIAILHGTTPDGTALTESLHLRVAGGEITAVDTTPSTEMAAAFESDAPQNGREGGMLCALLSHRTGPDFFQVAGDSEDTYRISRLCGEQAEQAIGELGNSWTCSDQNATCMPLDMCGNFCRSVVGATDGDGEMFVAASFEGMTGGGDIPLPAALLSEWRGQLECGERLEMDGTELSDKVESFQP